MSISDRPYAERRVLVFAKPPSSSGSLWDAAASAGKALGPVAWGVAGVALIAPLALLPVAAAAIGASKYIGSKSGKPADSGNAPSSDGLSKRTEGVLLCSDTSLANDLRFGVGHPLMEHAYAAHPLVKDRYIPLAAFHRFLFEEKVNELVSLLASLGATRVQVSAHKGYRSAGGIDFGASVPGKSGSGEANHKESSTSDAVFEEHYRPTGKPALPEGLIWFGHEASWQAVADRRLKFNTASFRAELRYEESFGVDGKLKVGLNGLGLKLGGNFSEFEETVWKFEGEFA